MDVDKVLSHIHREEVTQLALELGNIASPRGFERQAAEYVYGWLARNGFGPFKLSVAGDRVNVVGVLRGEGEGKSLLFNSHLDTAVGLPDDAWSVGELKPVHTRAWIEGDQIFGQSVVNDKGPLASYLIAAKAIKESGLRPKGDIILTAVVGEIGCTPVDEYQGPQYLGNGIGSKRLVEAGVVADYALVAEATDFAITWTEAGVAYFKITVYGEGGIYTPYIERPTPVELNPNAIVRACRVIEAIEDWAYSYEQRYRYEFSEGTVIPKVNIGAVRGGLPYIPEVTAGVCSIYVDVRLPPHETPLAAERELRRLVRGLGVDADIQLYLFRRGYEGKNVEEFVEVIKRAHQEEFKERPKRVYPPITSMWRDINVFNEVGIPSVTYGPGHGITDPKQLRGEAVSIEDLYVASKLYARIALDICR